MKTRAFYEVSCLDVPRQLTQRIKNEIEGQSKDYILKVNEEEYKSSLIKNYTIEPLIIDFENPHIAQPIVTKELVESRFRGEGYQTDVYNFTISYSYSGSSMLFKVQPNPFTLTSTEIDIDEQAKTVSFSFKLYKQDPEEFERTKNDYFRRAFSNYNNVNQTAVSWNNGLKGLIDSCFQVYKSKCLKENDFFASIGVTINDKK